MILSKSSLEIEIHRKFDAYLDIEQNVFGYLTETSKILIVNSIYLSIFTVFEDFIKLLIENYKEHNITNLSYSSFAPRLVEKMLIGDKYEIKSLSDFQKLNNLYSENINEREFKRLFSFKFLHLENLEKHYNDVFFGIFQTDYYLNKIDLIHIENIGNGVQVENRVNAIKFLNDYARIRNEIAHRNSTYSVDQSEYPLHVSIKYFEQLIGKICKDYSRIYDKRIDFLNSNMLEMV